MVGRLRITNVFGERANPASVKKPKDVLIISIAGEGKTEEIYFDGIKEKVISDIIIIERLEKIDPIDTLSHPKHVFELLMERKRRWVEYGASPDELWMVIDRDEQNVTSVQLKKIIEECSKESFNLALSNPNFELWLLLHLTEIDHYEKQMLLRNKKDRKRSKKRFLEKEIGRLSKGYKKGNLQFQKFESGISVAINRAKKMPLDNLLLIDDLGTTVCLLVDKIFKQQPLEF